MFPHCKVSLSGLIPCAKYILLVDMVPEDGFRYKVRPVSSLIAANRAPPQTRHPPPLSSTSKAAISSCFSISCCGGGGDDPPPPLSQWVVLAGRTLCGDLEQFAHEPTDRTPSLSPSCSGIKRSGKWREKRSPSLPAGPTCTRTRRLRGATG